MFLFYCLIQFLFSSNFLHNFVFSSAFSPLKLRLGGSLDDKVLYETGDFGLPCLPFVKNDSALFGYNDGCLPISRWDQLNKFFEEARVSVVFGLNALNGRVPMPDGSVGGNELSGKGIRARIDVAQYAKDTKSLKKIVDQIYEGRSGKPLIIAPGGNFEVEWYSQFIDLTKRSSSLDVITHHMYILGPGVDEHLVEKILNHSRLDLAASVFANLSVILRNAGSSPTAWVGEAGGAYNSGRNLVTNSFVSSFWYLDQLGMSANYDTKSYCRQSLIGGNYGLLNTTTFEPNPDYYSALLWHRLMGPKVLATDFIGTKKIRAYTHCARDSNGITLLLLNLDLIETAYVQVSIKSAEFTKETREEYHLTAKDGDLHSQTVLLNGKALNVDSYGQIPALEPLEVDGSQPIKVDPVSVVFAHLPYVHAPACI
ncbi:Heparanase-like protein 3 [Dendrobium catenatum]|uniref:Heparanase-like protein 3 n=1 Tax=Dendrobium catenatum TaxID=906689 RepID=A0A2I0V8K4_9ASPA|nr:Heparanase-like protein 3 [Dendrobium catenatum]